MGGGEYSDDEEASSARRGRKKKEAPLIGELSVNSCFVIIPSIAVTVAILRLFFLVEELKLMDSYHLITFQAPVRKAKTRRSRRRRAERRATRTRNTADESSSRRSRLWQVTRSRTDQLISYPSRSPQLSMNTLCNIYYLLIRIPHLFRITHLFF